METYRGRKKLVEELLEKGEISSMEAKSLTNAIEIAENNKGRGKYPNINKFIEVQKQMLENAIAEKKLSASQQRMLHTIKVGEIKKPILNNANELEKCVASYFQIVLEDSMKPTLNGLALAIGVNKIEILNIFNDRKSLLITDTNAKEVIKQAMQTLATANETEIAEGGIMGATFLGKNNYGMNDKTEINVKVDKEEMTDEQLDDIYKNIDIIDV